MTRDVRADVEQHLTKWNGRKPTQAELAQAMNFITLYMSASDGIKETIAEILEVCYKLHSQGKDDELDEYMRDKMREVENNGR